MQGREKVVRLRDIQHGIALDRSVQFVRHLHGHVLQASLLCLTAMYVAITALHDQPFRAVHGIVCASTLDAMLLLWVYHTTLCKRKPL